MRYKHFTIENFKGISEIKVDFSHNRILSFVGLNESGKTTILESMALFYELAQSGTITEERINRFRPKGDEFTGKMIISATLDLEEDDKKAIQSYWKNDLAKKGKGIEIPDEITIIFEFEFDLHAYKKMTPKYRFVIKRVGAKTSLHSTDITAWSSLIDYIQKNLTPEVLFYEDFIFEIPDKIVFKLNSTTPDTGEITSDINNVWKKVLDDILITINPRYTSFQKDVVDLWESDRSTADNRITKMEGELNKKITTAWKDLFKDGGKKLNFKEIRLVPNPHESVLEVSFAVITDGDDKFSINERSKGCKWFFSFLLFTEFRKNRSKNILFLLDEPASNLHSSAQAKILNAIEELSSSSMVAYSTHSHFLLKPEWLIGTYIVINENLSDDSLEGEMTFEDGAKISVEKYFNYIGLGKGNVKTSYFQPILDLLDYAPSAVEPAQTIVITEGKNDWYTFQYLNEIIGLKKKYDFHFYAGAGADQLWEIIRIYLSWGSNFIIVLDGDKTGIKAKEAYIKEFDGFINDKIFTLKDILGNDWETEDMFVETESERIIDTAFGSGVYKSSDKKDLKSKFNLAINQLLVEKKSVQINKPTKANFEKMFDFVEAKLKGQNDSSKD